MFILLQPLSQFQRILRMTLTAQTKRLQTQNQLLSREWIQRSTNIPQRLNPNPNSKRNRAKSFPKLKTVVALRGLDELRESSAVLSPVEFSTVDYYAADCCAVAAYPFCCAVDDDVGAVINWSGEVTACAEGIVDLGGMLA